MKTILTGYKMNSLQPLQSGAFHYTLTVVDNFWYRKPRTRTLQMKIDYHENTQPYYDLWHSLIHNRKPIKV
jgi:hypothetical protein